MNSQSRTPLSVLRFSILGNVARMVWGCIFYFYWEPSGTWEDPNDSLYLLAISFNRSATLFLFISYMLYISNVFAVGTTMLVRKNRIQVALKAISIVVVVVCSALISYYLLLFFTRHREKKYWEGVTLFDLLFIAGVWSFICIVFLFGGLHLVKQLKAALELQTTSEQTKRLTTLIRNIKLSSAVSTISVLVRSLSYLTWFIVFNDGETYFIIPTSWDHLMYFFVPDCAPAVCIALLMLPKQHHNQHRSMNSSRGTKISSSRV
eukprot:gnl/Dysnectes_brevis/614_a679_2602.p1 GENE.gnl/Dysnectes_brevis/614_a679_2602~~gnl/Dysnectes_brevis/614_a679_2602.p1  ORF type:complete len:308 (-),score=65.84 gnl/Dysnectes_brevis/614_a679_2602:544-1332(-)